jgi:hypothetical protein
MAEKMQGKDVVLVDPDSLPDGVQFGTLPIGSPKELIERATSIATALKKVVDDKHLYIDIRNKRHTYVEGWTCMLAMIGVTPREEGSQRFPDGSWEGTVGLYASDGHKVGGASALCGVDETDAKGGLTWASRPEYARKSMALTRATGKAARLSFSWIMVLAGYSPTPAEEMDGLGGNFAEGQVAEEHAPQSPGEYLVNLKKAKDIFGGKAPTIAALFEKEPEYVGWIADSIHDKPIGDAARAYIKDHPLPQKNEAVTEALPHDQVGVMGINLAKAIKASVKIRAEDFWNFQRASGFDQAFANDIRMKHTEGKNTDWKESLLDMFVEWNLYMDREGELFMVPIPAEA